MFPPELIALIKYLLTSKEVIGATVVLIIYFLLIFYVARTHHRKRTRRLALPLKRPKKEKPEKVSASEIMNDDDELGLEEE